MRKRHVFGKGRWEEGKDKGVFMKEGRRDRRGFDGKGMCTKEGEGKKI